MNELKLSKALRLPSAFLPIVMSSIAFAVVFVHVARFGVAREADEGTSAHLWQLLMAGQVPIIGFFAIKWFWKAPRIVFALLMLQFAAALLALAPVYFLHL